MADGVIRGCVRAASGPSATARHAGLSHSAGICRPEMQLRTPSFVQASTPRAGNRFWSAENLVDADPGQRASCFRFDSRSADDGQILPSLPDPSVATRRAFFARYLRLHGWPSGPAIGARRYGKRFLLLRIAECCWLRQASPPGPAQPGLQACSLVHLATLSCYSLRERNPARESIPCDCRFLHSG